VFGAKDLVDSGNQAPQKANRLSKQLLKTQILKNKVITWIGQSATNYN
jgi:hypothetical protein